ncbi:MAG: DNA polymerase I [Bacteroidetes bacterium]|jgi:DNA polymerase-1|nr:DNA polymerase I [Bacteroidota bacterium]
MSDKKLFLLDAYALIFRAYYAFIKNPRITSYGLNTSAVFGFTNTLLDVLQNQKPTHIAVVFDHKSENIRKQDYPLYKANRDETPEDIKLSEPYIRRVIEAFNIPILEAEGYEADDVIGTLTKKAEAAGFTTYMMTPDKDFGQLVTEKSLMYKPARSGNSAEIWGPAEVCERFKLDNTLQVIDYLGLMGDAVDNIPGVPGVGPKTASTLLKQYGTMEKLYENTHELKGKLKEKVEDNKEQAFMSRKLATILLDAPVPFDESSLITEEPNKDAIRKLFDEVEFKTLYKRVLGESPASISSGGQQSLFGDMPTSGSRPSATKVANEITGVKTLEDVKHTYELVDTEEKRKSLLEKLLKQKTVCFDTETTSLDPLLVRILGCAFSFELNKGYYVNFPDDFEESKAILESFNPFFQNKEIEMVLQNAKYDIKVLWNYDIEVEGKLFDTMLAHYLIEPDQRHNMDYLAETYLGYKPISITDLIGKKGKNQLSFDTVPLDKATEYAVEDADITLQLKEAFGPSLVSEEVRSVFDRIEIPLIKVLGRMEREGVNVNTAFLANYSVELEKESAEIEKTIYEQAGVQFNIASPKQLGEVLFDHMKLDAKAKKTKTGQYKTDEATLTKLADVHALPKMILEYRHNQKLKSTYVDAIPRLVNPNTNRVHTNFAQAVAATGRLSSTNPNLQNIPIRTDKGREIRKAFIPRDENHILVAADYSQIELRIVASMSGDEAMSEAFVNGLDIHTATAAKVFGVELDDVTKEQRYKAKSVNFGLIYGQGATGLSQNLKIKRSEAQELIDAYFDQFSGIKKYMDDTIKTCRDYGYVKTLMGRKRQIRDINSQNRTVVGFAERNAVNAPIQGSAADMIKLAMINIDAALRLQGFKSKMILQVHDELLFDVHKDELDSLKMLIKPLMEHAMPLNVPTLVEIGEGQTWLEAH